MTPAPEIPLADADPLRFKVVPGECWWFFKRYGVVWLVFSLEDDGNRYFKRSLLEQSEW